MHRRDFLKCASAAGIAVAVDNANATLRNSPAAAPRQVVVILGESIRADMLNCYRQTGLKTPNLDRLAAHGARFDRAYDCQPVCSPARSAIWTGMYPHTNGVWGNSMPLGDTVHTIGQHLHDRGVSCGYMGKWHLSGTDYFDTGIPQPGWDPAYWYDMRDYLSELSPEDRLRSRNRATGKDPSWTAEMCFGHRCTNRAMDFIGTHKDKDFLLAVAYDEPHGPSLCPVEYSQMYSDFVFPGDRNVNDDLKNKPAEQAVWADGRLGQPPTPIKQAQFFGAHTFIDQEIGRLLNTIEASVPGAMILYTSDHGVFLDAHRLLDKGPAMYDEITRVPFLVKWPGITPANTVSSSLVSHIDIAPTLLDFFGFEAPKTLEGQSMLPLLRNPQSTPRKEVFVEWGRYEVDHDGFGGYQPIRCIRNERYKLSIHLMTTDELYDMKEDPAEMNNLIDSPGHAGLRNAMHDKLMDWMDTSRDPFRGYYWGRRAWRLDYAVNWENHGMTRQRESDGYLPRELDYDTGLPMSAATRPKTK
jgi:uncharacterized sulfatase